MIYIIVFEIIHLKTYKYLEVKKKIHVYTFILLKQFAYIRLKVVTYHK